MSVIFTWDEPTWKSRPSLSLSDRLAVNENSTDELLEHLYLPTSVSLNPVTAAMVISSTKMTVEIQASGIR